MKKSVRKTKMISRKNGRKYNFERCNDRILILFHSRHIIFYNIRLNYMGASMSTIVLSYNLLKSHNKKIKHNNLFERERNLLIERINNFEKIIFL